MAQAVRPLMEWLRWQHRHYFHRAPLHHFLYSPSLLAAAPTISRPLYLPAVPSFHRHFRTHGLKSQPKPRAAPDSRQITGDSDSDSDEKKSRNQKKREAQRAVRWGMELASFSPTKIKRILRVASLETEVFEAIMLVKRLGRDVREGKRRQFNYIGRLLREVEPELMDGLIEATKTGDQSKFQALSGSETWVGDDDEVVEETKYEEEEEGSHKYIDIATRWFDGLINKDVDITKEIYSLQDIDFDRQELRRLVREVHSMKEHQITLEDDEGRVDAAIIGAESSLTRFLRTLAKQVTKQVEFQY